ncbi:nicotianamine synthase family protein [Desulfonema magnum]|uniref:Nicotianamine synthase family protein n=1 Tax=Desulfonema magnum TaxID=45655 RepID=A0A975BPW8_9BACT|nr:nicotianamine synthase family protein [Desulfonema magnum]QTA89527.1 Nicotianamine synthase family protein [Desulfonema magnum]
MHNISYAHTHELDESDFSGCCRDCDASVNIIKPHIIAFARRIRKYSPEMLASLSLEELCQLYQLLDDLAHLNTGDHLAGLILEQLEIRQELPTIRSYYTLFFSIHEVQLAEKLLKSADPWNTLKSFPLYPRYEALVRNQIQAMQITKNSRLAFVGSGPVPMSLILMSHLCGLRSVGLDISSQSVELSRKVIRHLGLEEDIEIIHGDESCLKELEWNMVLIAALAEPKAHIFQNLHNLLKHRGNHIPIIFRTYTGMRAVLYEPVQPGDISGFKIVREIFPTGRVNNTTVFAELNA